MRWFGGVFAVGLVLVASLPASAATIIVRSGTANADLGDFGFTPVTSMYGSWTQSAGNGYSAVTITANICTVGSATLSTATVYLTNSIGAGTTIANQIATGPIGTIFVCAPNSPSTTIFSGLTLPAGTYYLVFSNMSLNFGWRLTSGGATEAVGTGVTANSDASSTAGPPAYPPSDTTFTALSFGGSSHVFLYSVTGTAGLPVSSPTGAPTLSSWGLLGMIVLLGGSGLLMMGKIPPPNHDSLRPH